MTRTRTYSMRGVPLWILGVAPWAVGVVEIIHWIIRGAGL